MKRIVALVPMLLLAGVQPARAQVVANLQVAATAEDTALARTLLTDALRAFRRIETPIGQSHFEERFVAQFAAWGMHDQAWDLALAFDTSAAQGGTDSGYWLTARLIGALYEQGDSVTVASRFADRTANGEARVRANFVVARALLAADSVAQAQTRIASVLPNLNPVWRCEGYCIGIADDASGFARMSRSLIGNVVALAFRAGATRELREWVFTHADAERRAAAALAVVEGLAQHRLGRWNYYPMH